MKVITPSGFRDILPAEAIEREKIRRASEDLFSKHGYLPIETPTLEVMDVIDAGGKSASSPFKFFDSRGDLLAMRPDVTMQVARMCASRIADTDSPLKFRYTQRVFRETEGKRDVSPREITQIGIECIGQTGSDADFEIIELFVEALKVSEAGSICLCLASVAPLRALLDRSGGRDEWKNAILDAYHRSDFVELENLTDLSKCDSALADGIAPAYADAVFVLSRIRGGKEAVKKAKDLVGPLGCSVGLDELEQIYERLIECKNCDRILVDFSVISSFDYYTGIVFEAYSPYLGSSLGGGGRYDNMISTYGKDLPAAGFAFCLEQVMAANAADTNDFEEKTDEAAKPGIRKRKIRIAVPKGALNKDAVSCLEQAGLDVGCLDSPGRSLVISTDDADFFIVRPSDAPAFVSYGAADCGICGRDSLLESGAQVVELVNLKFGACKFVVAAPEGSKDTIDERYRKLGSIRVATKYPNITLEHFANTGIQVDIVKLNGNIELAPLTGMAEEIVDITATGTTLRENNLVIIEDVLESSARFFANPCALRTDDDVVDLADRLAEIVGNQTYEPIAGASM